MNFLHKILTSILFAALLFPITACFDVSGVDSGDGPGAPQFASGPTYGTYYPVADGVIDAARETLGIFMENRATEGTLENAELLVSGGAYMGMIQEDLFRFARDKYIEQYTTDPDTAQKKYLKMASQIQVVMAAYNEDVFLLVNDSSGITTLGDLAGKIVNVGSENSGTYVTATTILTAKGIIPGTKTTEDAAAAVSKVVAGTCDAAFMVAGSPNETLAALDASAPVKLIQVTMPDGKKYYSENGTINSEDYAFQDSSVSGNIQVKSLVAVGPNFNDRVVDIFIEHILTHAEDYSSYNQKWLKVTLSRTFQYMRDNPQVSNYRAICKVAGSPSVHTMDVEPEIYSGDYGSSASEMAGELIWLMSHNLDVDLKEVNSTGARENAIRLADGSCAMALVQDDLFDFYVNREQMDDSVRVASMKKVMPLHYEYLHLLVDSSITSLSRANFYTAGVNVGPKTSGTFVTAMNVMKSYSFDESDELFYYFDAPDVSVQRVNSGDSVNGHEYNAAFVLSGLPFEYFYSHDTWDVAVNLNASSLIDVHFYAGIFPDAYSGDGDGFIRGTGGSYEDYPYPNAWLPTHEEAVRVRSLLVASPAFDDKEIATFIKAVFRKAYYKTNPTDPDFWSDFNADQLWIGVRKENVNYDAAHDIYDDVMGAKEYFMRNPFNWTKYSSEYFLSMFPDNE